MDDKRIGIIGYWFATNYGGVASYYSLYNNLKKMGYYPFLVENPYYYTDREGAFPYGILINRDQTIRVKLKDPFENGNEYECELTLHVPEIGEANPKSIIFVKKNGSCNVVSTDEYFMW